MLNGRENGTVYNHATYNRTVGLQVPPPASTTFIQTVRVRSDKLDQNVRIVHDIMPSHTSVSAQTRLRVIGAECCCHSITFV
jgi:hypothetical protein